MSGVVKKTPHDAHTAHLRRLVPRPKTTLVSACATSICDARSMQPHPVSVDSGIHIDVSERDEKPRRYVSRKNLRAVVERSSAGRCDGGSVVAEVVMMLSALKVREG